MRNTNGFKIGLCMLTFGITLGYFLAKLMNKLDFHVFCVGSGGQKPKFLWNCCQEEPGMAVEEVSPADCPENENEPEPSTEPSHESAMEYEEP